MDIDENQLIELANKFRNACYSLSGETHYTDASFVNINDVPHIFVKQQKPPKSKPRSINRIVEDSVRSKTI